jgi:hypothetical protein
MAAFAETLRTGAWLTRERVRLVGWAVLAASAIGLIWLLATSNGLNDSLNRPLGTDFSNVYAAGTYVRDGEPAKPFDPVAQHTRERAIFGDKTPFYGWHYPPFFLAVAVLLGTMPYLLALAIWQATTFAAYLLTMRAVLRPLMTTETLWVLLAAGFPAVFINLGHGHNGFLTAALITAALLTLDTRPILSGVLIGCLAYKPQFGLLIPLVLVATGRWRSFAAAALTVAAMSGAVTLAFGIDVWHAFFASGEFTRKVVLEMGDTGWHKIQSVFSWARMWGANVPLAYALQGVTALTVAVALIRQWRSDAPFTHKAAALLIGSLLATPYSLDYDLMLLAPAIAFLVVDGIERGFAPWRKTLLAALWIVPLVTRSVAELTLIPLAAPLMIAAFILILRQAPSAAFATQNKSA